MSREQYQVPTGSPSFGGATAAGSNAGSGYNSQAAGASAANAAAPAVTYICGECSSKVGLTRGAPIRCNECGHRILYKERTKRMVQFEAR